MEEMQTETTIIGHFNRNNQFYSVFYIKYSVALQFKVGSAISEQTFRFNNIE